MRFFKTAVLAVSSFLASSAALAQTAPANAQALAASVDFSDVVAAVMVILGLLIAYALATGAGETVWKLVRRGSRSS